MLSILTPAYIDSVEKLEWLNEMLASVQSQLFEDWEVILMDDASSVSLTLQKPDERVRQFRMTLRSGPALARNTAAALARGEALLPVDADDVLPSPETLALMYSAWQNDKSKIIYGDLQRYEQIEGVWRRGRVFNLPEYSFEKVMDLNGLIPVTAMHSKECHLKAGGWKPELEAGREDVEYWISAGKAGFCGQRLDDTITLLYRMHENSRDYQLKFVNQRVSEMNNAIRLMHKDVYEGKYPMGCCGGGKAYVPPSAQNTSTVAPASTLAQFGAGEKVWVEYAGAREGSFGLVGDYTNISYKIDGPGHKLEVHINDLPKFKRSGRGADFKIGVTSPNGVPKQEVKNGTEYKAPEPQLGQILRLDEIANGTL